MNTIKRCMISAIAILPLTFAQADEPDDLADTVSSFMIESYNYVLNINLLSELCALETYLEVNTNSKEFNEKLHANIKKFAEISGQKNYSANQVAAKVETKFLSFMQGVRYGGFIADNFVKTKYPEGVCSPETRIDLGKSIASLIKKDEFYLSDE